MRLYDTFSRSLVELPRPPAPVRMYVCGPTVYARAHVGNARPFVFGMWLRAWLLERGYEATLVHNITDVNDKIYDAAPGASAALAERATRWYLQDTGDLGLGMPDRLPKATESIPAIVAFIERLIASGHAYAVGGDVYFRVASFPEYGLLSGQRPDQLEDTEPNPLKEDPRDFALWKANKPETEDTWWDSPWGRRSRGSGRTTGCCGSRARRCRSRSATSPRCARRSTSGAARRCWSSSSRRTGASRSTSRRRRSSRRRRGVTRCGTRSRSRPSSTRPAGRCATRPAASRSSRAHRTRLERRSRLRPPRSARGVARTPAGARAVGHGAGRGGGAVARGGGAGGGDGAGA